MTPRRWDLLLDHCYDFALRVLPTNIYHEHKSQDRTRDMIACGKMGEFLIAFSLDERGTCCEPDVQVYPGHKKSYDPDLVFNGKGVHCKTTTLKSAQRWGESWCFNKNDPIVSSPDESLVALCTLDMDKKVCQLYGPYPTKQIIPLLVEPTAKNQKKKIKVLTKERLSDTTFDTTYLFHG